MSSLISFAWWLLTRRRPLRLGDGKTMMVSGLVMGVPCIGFLRSPIAWGATVILEKPQKVQPFFQIEFHDPRSIDNLISALEHMKTLKAQPKDTDQ